MDLPPPRAVLVLGAGDNFPLIDTTPDLPFTNWPSLQRSYHFSLFPILPLFIFSFFLLLSVFFLSLDFLVTLCLPL